MRLLVTDTETTGDGDRDQVIEIAVRGRRVDSSGSMLARWQHHQLVRPTCSIDCRARAAHHIRDDQLAGEPTMEDLLQQEDHLGGLRGRSADDDDRVFVAHWALFDRRMLMQSAGSVDLFLPRLEICTYRCALHLWPDAPSHKNQVLRYWLDLKVPVDDSADMAPHRAKHDTIVTELMLERMLALRTVEELIDLTTTPVLLQTCKLGEHAGKPWSDVPVSFLRWLLAKGPRRPNPRGGRDVGFSEDERHTAQYWASVHEAEQRARYEAARASRLARSTLASTSTQATLPLATGGDDGSQQG